MGLVLGGRKAKAKPEALQGISLFYWVKKKKKQTLQYEPISFTTELLLSHGTLYASAIFSASESTFLKKKSKLEWYFQCQS